MKAKTNVPTTENKNASKLKECNNCRWWTPISIGVIGECEIDMETKMRHQTCTRFEERKATQ